VRGRRRESRLLTFFLGDSPESGWSLLPVIPPAVVAVGKMDDADLRELDVDGVGVANDPYGVALSTTSRMRIALTIYTEDDETGVMGTSTASLPSHEYAEARPVPRVMELEQYPAYVDGNELSVYQHHDSSRPICKEEWNTYSGQHAYTLVPVVAPGVLLTAGPSSRNVRHPTGHPTAGLYTTSAPHAVIPGKRIAGGKHSVARTALPSAPQDMSRRR
jgi:hypothetical protein